MSSQAPEHLHDLYEDAPAPVDRVLQYRGLGWVVLSDVFAPYPTFGSTTGITKKNIAMYEGKRVLDLGCGSGVRGIIAALSGAERVVATDIHDRACQNTALNAQRHNVAVDIVCADMFACMAGRFDTIVSYLPSRDAPVGTLAERAIHDPGLRLNRQLLDEAPAFLEPGGTLHTSFLDQDGSVLEMEDLIADNGYNQLSHVVRPHAETGDWHFFSLQNPA